MKSITLALGIAILGTITLFSANLFAETPRQPPQRQLRTNRRRSRHGSRRPTLLDNGASPFPINSHFPNFSQIAVGCGTWFDMNQVSLLTTALPSQIGVKLMPRYMTSFLRSIVLVAFLAATPCVTLAEDDKLDTLIKQLADRNPENQLAACQAIAALGEKGAPAGAALVELMLRDRLMTPASQAAADALEKAAPKVHPHVLTIMLNNDSKGQMRLGAAREIGGLGEAGAAALPVLKALWSEPSHNYKQFTLLTALHAVGPHDPQVSKLVLMIARGDLDRKYPLGNGGKGVALAMVVESNLSDDEINSALLASVVGQYMGHKTIDQIVERVQSGKASAEKFTQAFVTVFVGEAKRNRYDFGSVKALKALGVDAASAVPTLRAMRNHPDPTIRGQVKEILDVIEQAEAVKTPEMGETWEITDVQKNGRAYIRCGNRELSFRQLSDRTVVFDAEGKQLRDNVDIASALKVGVRLQVQLDGEKLLSVRLAK